MADQLHSRRGVLRLGAASGAGALAAWTLGVSDIARAATGSASAVTAAGTSTGCATLTKDETQGPFWVDERLKRSDIRRDSDTGALQGGVPLRFTMTILDAGGSCAPEVGAYVDIWHCNAQGAYSDVTGAGNPDTRGVDWLRGYQVTDANGQVTFTTVYPGWYAGRATHIHFRVRSALSASSSVNFTSQLFFSESVNNAVYATSAYTKSGTRSTTNSNDGLYDATLVMPVQGSTTNGYTGAFQVNLDFDGSTDASTDTTVSAVLSSAWVVRGKRGRRTLKVRTWNGEVVTPLVRLTRGDDVLASRRWGWWSAGSRVRGVAIPRRVKRGHARAHVRFVDRAGHAKIATLPVRVPRKRR